MVSKKGYFLTKFASKIMVLEFQDQLRVSQILWGKAEKHPNIRDDAWQGSPEIQRKRPLGVDNRLGSENR